MTGAVADNVGVHHESILMLQGDGGYQKDFAVLSPALGNIIDMSVFI